jgi:transposase
MEAREQRGALIAATQIIKHAADGNGWLVPSQSGNGKYTVRVADPKSPRCSCPDHEAGFKCKHIYAVEFMFTRVRQEENVDGSVTTITESVTVKTTAERKTYKQPWHEYDLAMKNERRHFHELLANLCDMIPEPAKDRSKGGRPSIPLRDGLFAACLKVYSLMSVRRFNGELEEAHERGYISRLPHYNHAVDTLDKEEVTPILKAMIETSAFPLRAVETVFATDSTGFATTNYASWFDKKYNQMREGQTWVKAHFTTGVTSNIVTAVNIDHQDAADSPQLPALTEKTAETFKIAEMSADKAYGSVQNFAAVEAHGGQFFPMFKSNTTGAAGGSFEKTFHYFSFKRDEYLAHYHQRSNVESTVSMIKRKFGDAVKAKNDTAQKNEVYAKFVCHNICVLIQEMYIMGIDPSFGRAMGCRNTGSDVGILRFPG